MENPEIDILEDNLDCSPLEYQVYDNRVDVQKR